MRKIIVLLAVMLALVGAAAANSISGSGSYTWNGAAGAIGSGSQTFQSGMSLDLYTGATTGTPVAASTVGNTMTVNWKDLQTDLVNTIGASQYGSNSIALNNAQEPGSTSPQVQDFQASSTAGGALTIASEGFGILNPTTTTHSVDFTATSTGYEVSNQDFLQKDVILKDTNTVSGYAQPDQATYPVVANVPESGTDQLTSHLKTSTFTWDCTDGGSAKFEDSYTKDQIVSSGITSSTTATAEANPLWNGVAGTAGQAGFTTFTNGQQKITMTQTTNFV